MDTIHDRQVADYSRMRDVRLLPPTKMQPDGVYKAAFQAFCTREGIDPTDIDSALAAMRKPMESLSRGGAALAIRDEHMADILARSEQAAAELASDVIDGAVVVDDKGEKIVIPSAVVMQRKVIAAMADVLDNGDEPRDRVSAAKLLISIYNNHAKNTRNMRKDRRAATGGNLEAHRKRVLETHGEIVLDE